MNSSQSRTACEDGAPGKLPRSAMVSHPSCRSRSLTARHHGCLGVTRRVDEQTTAGLPAHKRQCRSAERQMSRCVAGRAVESPRDQRETAVGSSRAAATCPAAQARAPARGSSHEVIARTGSSGRLSVGRTVLSGRLAGPAPVGAPVPPSQLTQQIERASDREVGADNAEDEDQDGALMAEHPGRYPPDRVADRLWAADACDERAGWDRQPDRIEDEHREQSLEQRRVAACDRVQAE